MNRVVVSVVALTLLFGGASAVLAEDEVTFTKDVAPIFAKACMTCHRPGEIAPMSLLSFEEARPWARSIKREVVSRAMPPCSSSSSPAKFWRKVPNVPRPICSACSRPPPKPATM